MDTDYVAGKLQLVMIAGGAHGMGTCRPVDEPGDGGGGGDAVRRAALALRITHGGGYGGVLTQLPLEPAQCRSRALAGSV